MVRSLETEDTVFLSTDRPRQEDDIFKVTAQSMRNFSYGACDKKPKPANLLRRMLDENEGSGKDQFLGDPDWSSEM